MADKDTPAKGADEEIVGDDKKEDTTPPASKEEKASKGKEAPAKATEDEPDADLIEQLAEGVKGEVTTNEDATVLEDAEPEPAEEPKEPAGEGEPKPADKSAEEEEPAEETPEPVADPGDFKPGDYSFEIKLTDGKTVKISTPEDAETFAGRLDAEEGLISASQFLQFNRKSAAMDIGIANDRKAYDAQQEVYKEQQALETAQTEALDRWDKEINYMAEKGELPKISAELNRADWTDPEVAKDPAVKARTELLAWADAENNRRIAAGLDPITSMIDAHNAMQLEQLRKGEKTAEDEERKGRRARGAMVNAPSSGEPMVREGKDVVGTGGTLEDLVSEFYET